MPPLPRFDKLPDDKRREILDAAAREFAERGFEGASFNRIIATSGVSKGAMYYYFADKSDAYGAVLDDVLERAREAVRDLERPSEPAGYWAMLSAGLDRLGERFFSDVRLAALLRGLYQGGTNDATLRRLVARCTEWVEALLAEGQVLGAVRTDVPLELLAEAVTGMLVSMDRWFAERMTRSPADAPPDDEVLALAPKILELIRDLLEPKERKP